MSTRRRIAVLVSVALAGVGLIAWGWIRQGVHGYLPGLLANLGTALLLGVLFIVLQATITRKIEDVRSTTHQLETGLGEVQQELARTSERLDELTNATTERIQTARTELADQIAGLNEDVSFERVAGLLERGDELQALSRRGVRVRLPHADLRLRWQYRLVVPQGYTEREPIIQILLEDPSGKPLDVVVAWSPGQLLSEVIANLAEDMKRQGVYPGDAAMDTAAVVRSLAATLQLAIEARGGVGGTRELSHVVELVNERWALTDHGLEHLGTPVLAISPSELRDHERRNTVRGFTWVAQDVDKFEQAWDLGQRYHASSDPTRERGRLPRFGVP